jgi:hypothetical protein
MPPLILRLFLIFYISDGWLKPAYETLAVFSPHITCLYRRLVYIKLIPSGREKRVLPHPFAAGKVFLRLSGLELRLMGIVFKHWGQGLSW